MGKSKKKKGPSGGRSEPSHVGGAAGSGASVAESHEEAFVVEQRRLLEECQRSRAAAEGRAAEDVIERQRRLLEEASSAVTAAAPGGGGGGGSGGGSGGGGAAAPSSAASAAATAAAVPGAGAAADVGDVFSVRRVKFFGRKVPVLLQNRNGPCALLAATNCLLLRGIMTLRDDERSVAGEDLVSRLAALSRRLNAKGIDEDANVSGAVEKMIERLPGLLEGLLLNCRFGGCKDFECTEDLALFDMFGLPLYHAWVDSDVAKVAASWNALTERLVVCAEIRDNLERERRQPTPDEDARLAEGVWLEDWLEETRAQSTPRGLRELTASVGEREVCVLFRNNHFCTLFKPRSEALCALLTDVSFESMASAVWEQIGLDGCGASTILDADFRAVEAPAAEAAGGASPAGAAGLDAALRDDLLQRVEELGFSRDLAEAGLAAVDWRSAEEAVEALLEADGDAPVPTGDRGRGGGGGGASSSAASGPSYCVHPTKHICPSCGKEVKSWNGLLNHRAMKGH